VRYIDNNKHVRIIMGYEKNEKGVGVEEFYQIECKE
jgi:hypothetical protein